MPRIALNVFTTVAVVLGFVGAVLGLVAHAWLTMMIGLIMLIAGVVFRVVRTMRSD